MYKINQNFRMKLRSIYVTIFKYNDIYILKIDTLFSFSYLT